MATSTLEVIIRGKDLLTPTINKASASLSGLKANADGLKGSILAGVGLGAGIGAFGLMTTAVSKFTDVLGDSVTAAMEDEASVRRLTQTLQENAPAWNGSMAAIERFTKTGQQLAFTDDAIRESIGKLTVSTGDVTRAMDLTRLGMDLARLKGIDLATATDYINKALGGQIGALRRVLPFIDANATATQALTAIQQAAEGQAESYASTTEGSLVRSQIAMKEAMESLGRVTMPALAEATGAVAIQFEWLARSTDDVNKFLRDLTGVIPGVDENFNILGATLENLPLVGTWIKTNQLRDAQEAAAQAALDHANAVAEAKDSLADGADQTDAYAGALGRLSDATYRSAILMEALRVQINSVRQEQNRVNATNEGAMKAQLAAAAGYKSTNEWIAANLKTVPKLTSAEKDKTGAAKALTGSLNEETVAIEEGTNAIIERLKAEGAFVTAITAADKAINARNSGRTAAEAHGRIWDPVTGQYVGGDQAQPTGPKGTYATGSAAGGGAAAQTAHTWSMSGSGGGSGSGGAMAASGGLYDNGTGTPIVITLDGRVIAEVVDRYLVRL